MKLPRIVIDTNVLVSAFRSKRGASFKLISLIGKNKFSYSISVPLMFEYEEIIKRKEHRGEITIDEIDRFLNRLCFFADKREIFFLWRPYLKDPDDDMVLELAVEANCNFIITYNKNDYKGLKKFSIKVLTPKEFLIHIGEIKWV